MIKFEDYEVESLGKLVNKEFDYDRYLIHLDLINKINNL
jgi:hypothetical protein